MQFLSQDLSISDIYDKEDKEGKEFYIGQDIYQSVNNDIMNSNEIPLNRQRTDFTNKMKNLHNDSSDHIKKDHSSIDQKIGSKKKP